MLYCELGLVIGLDFFVESVPQFLLLLVRSAHIIDRVELDLFWHQVAVALVSHVQALGLLKKFLDLKIEVVSIVFRWLNVSHIVGLIRDEGLWHDDNHCLGLLLFIRVWPVPPFNLFSSFARLDLPELHDHALGDPLCDPVLSDSDLV